MPSRTRKKNPLKDDQAGQIIAVIDIGSSAIRLLIAEVGKSKGRSTNADWRILDSADRAVQLGRDVFETGTIGRRTMLQAIEILQAFREMMIPYPISQIEAIGTSALREARNSEIFIDRARLQTGINIRVIDGVETNQLTFLAVRNSVKNSPASFFRRNVLVMEVGGGSTELMVLKRGKMVAARTLTLGTIRIQQQIDSNQGKGRIDAGELLRQQTRSVLDTVAAEHDFGHVSQLVAVGGDARVAARTIGVEESGNYWRIERERFQDFVSQLDDLTVDEIAAKLDLSYMDAESLLPALMVYEIFMEATAAESLVVPTTSIREGLLLNFAIRPAALREVFHKQILASAKSLAKHYKADLGHAEYVGKLAVRLFDHLEHEHGLSTHGRVLLEAAAWLHDIGTFISASSHHKHGMYLVMNSEIFGLKQNEKEMVANIVRYHRKAKPQSAHSPYTALPLADRMVVQKLSAILRVADALDRAHEHRVDVEEIRITDDAIILTTKAYRDLSLEQYSLKGKANLFEDVFGLQVNLR